MGLLNLAMGAVQLFGGMSAAKDAKKAAKAQAAVDTRVMQEKVYQLGKKQEQMRSETIAAAAGSGVKTTSRSVADLLTEQAETIGREILFTQQVGAERAQQAMQRGRMAADQARFAGATGALAAFGMGGQARAETGSWFKFG